MKKGAASMRNRISAWILTLVMIVGLVAVPAGEAQAEERITVKDATTVSTNSPYVKLEAKSTIPAGEWGANSPAVDLTEYNVTVYNASDSMISDWEITIQCKDASSWNAGWNGATRVGNTITIGTYKGVGNDGQWSNAEIAAGETGSGAGFQIAASAIEGAEVTLTYKKGESSGTVSQDDTITDPAGIGEKSSSVTAEIKENQVSGEYHEYYLKVNNGLSESISDWIVAVPVKGITSSEQWGDWAKVKTSFTSDYLYLTPSTPTVIAANNSFGSTSEDAYKFNYKGSQNIDTSKAVVYYKTGTSATGAFDSVVKNATQATGGSGGTGGGGAQGDTTTDLGLEIEYNYAKLLQESLYFYDANMCGPKVGETSAFSWRDDCHTMDQTANYNGKTVDVSGGFHDAGDHVKFGLPQGYSAAVLALGYYQFKDAYDELGQTQHLQTILDYFCDYFVNCAIYTDNDNKTGEVEAFCYQVGDGTDGSPGSDHGYWGPPEDQEKNGNKYNRDTMTLFTNDSQTATDIVSISACALALHAYNFPDGDRAKQYLQTAKDLFAYATEKAKKTYVVDQYKSDSWEDDYCSAAAALYLATEEEQYKTAYDRYKNNMNAGWVLCWNKTWGIAAALMKDWNNVQSIAAYGSTNTPQGFKVVDGWGSARYNTTSQFLGLFYDSANNKFSMEEGNFCKWATGQMKYLLGNNSSKRCFVVGYNANSSQYPHHRAASRSSDAAQMNPAHYTLLGALVGGPDGNDAYTDSQSDYRSNEVAIDYNAGFVGAAAGLYLLHKDDKDAVNTLATKEELSELAVDKYYGASATPVEIQGVTLDEAKSLVVGEKAGLTVKLTPGNATYQTITWESDEETVASVAGTGKTATITALKSGEAEIKVTVTDTNGKGYTATCTVTVTNPVKTFELEPSAITLAKGKEQKLTYKVTPENPDAYTITWKSSDKEIATVGEDGTVTAVGKGETKITATLTQSAGETTITASCDVKVNVPLSGITIDKTELTLNKGEEAALVVTPDPEDADLGEVTWTSDSGDIVSVKGDGAKATITAKAKGTANITAMAGGKEVTCKVTVTNLVMEIRLPATKEVLVADASKPIDLSSELVYDPADADDDDKQINWSSDSEDVTVNANGLVSIEKQSKGATATITATLKRDERISTQCKISVVQSVVQSIEITPKELTLTIGGKGQLQAQVTPEDADNAKNIEWVSDNKDVAEVDKEGNVTAGKIAGTAIITAFVGNVSATCTVTVQKKTQEKPSVTLTKVSRTSDSITVSAALSSAQENTSGKLELSIDSGKSWEPVDAENQVTFSGLKEFTPYTVKARLAATDEYEASELAKEDLTVYTLVKEPYTVDVSKFASDAAEEYADALRTADNEEPTVTYDANEKKLTLSEPDEKYTITGDNEDLTIVTGKDTGNYDMTLKDATVKEVEASAPGAVDMEIQGQVTVKDGVTASGDTDITIHGQSRKDTLTTPFVSTEGDLTVKQVTVDADATQTEKPALAGDTVTIDDAAVNAAGGTGKPAVKGNEVDLKNNPELQLKSDAGQKGIDAESIVIEDKADVNFSGEEKDKYSVPPVDSNGNPYAEQKNPEEQKDPVKPQDPADDKTAITSITVSLPAATMEVGDAVKATATVQPANADNEVLWSSSNSNVLTVSDTGMVTAIAAGTADVIATAADGSGKSGRFTVTVVDTEEDEDDSVEATGLAVTASVKGAGEIPVKGTMKLALKKKLTLNVEFLPEDAEEEDVTFTSSNPKVAQINDEGTVTGKKAGKAVITVKSDSGLQKTVKIQVMKKPVTKVKIKASKTTIKVKKTVKLKAVVTPNKKLASNGIFWKSSNPKIATVSASGVVKGVKKGKVKITAVATDGSGKKATVTIKIN